MFIELAGIGVPILCVIVVLSSSEISIQCSDLNRKFMKLADDLHRINAKSERKDRTVLEAMYRLEHSLKHEQYVHGISSKNRDEECMRMLKSIRANTIEPSDDIRLIDQSILQTIKELSEVLNKMLENGNSLAKKVDVKKASNTTTNEDILIKHKEKAHG